MRVLVACEKSGVVRDAFLRLGHDAYSCDLQPAESPTDRHLQTDILDVLDLGWDLLIAHPPCTYLCGSGLHWNKRRPGRAAQTEEGVRFAKLLWDAPIAHIALENPIGCLSTRLRKPDQIIQPWQYGHPESKSTCLWLRGLPKLQPTCILTPVRFQGNGRPQWDNQTPSGQNKLGPGPEREANRSRTYTGIADAMAAQWGAGQLQDRSTTGTRMVETYG